LLAGIILASGIFNNVLTHVPLLAGYREPQKFAGLVALGLSLLASFGTAAALRYVRQELQKSSAIFVGFVLFLLPVIVTATIFWGGRGQLQARSYPAGWAEANKQLSADNDNFQTLFLPWHLYMHFNFADRIIVNPAPNYFDKPVIVSDDPEFEGSKPSASTFEQRQISELLEKNLEAKDSADQLAKLNVKYVVLAHDNDYQKYTGFVQSPHLKLQFTSASIDLYRNESWRQ
jgi:hypothetical protein